jgi:hypothetical protein
VLSPAIALVAIPAVSPEGAGAKRMSERRDAEHENTSVSPISTTETTMTFTIAGVTLDRLPTCAELAEIVLDPAERTFGRRADGTLLERYALEAAIDILSRPSPRLSTDLPDLARRQVRDALETNAP